MASFSTYHRQQLEYSETTPQEHRVHLIARGRKLQAELDRDSRFQPAEQSGIYASYLVFAALPQQFYIRNSIARGFTRLANPVIQLCSFLRDFMYCGNHYNLKFRPDFILHQCKSVKTRGPGGLKAVLNQPIFTGPSGMAVKNEQELLASSL